MRISNDGPEVFSSLIRISEITQQNHRMNALTSKSWFWGGAKWPSNHFCLYTARCVCTEAQEMRAPCMFDWQDIQTFFFHWNAKSQIRSLVCTLHNSNIAITSLVCTLRNSECAIQIHNSNYALCSHVKTVFMLSGPNFENVFVFHCLCNLAL